MSEPEPSPGDLAAAMRSELVENILPFWMEYAPDRDRGGFHGEIGDDLRINDGAQRGSVLCSRILWTFASAYRRIGKTEYLDAADWAFRALTETFIDPEYGGVFWSVDSEGNPVEDRKHHYAQAFAIYGLTEYHRVRPGAGALELAQSIYELLEEHARDRRYGGYIEGSARDWSELERMRLSERDLESRKSMNTMLHVIEAYSNLLRVHEDQALARRHHALITLFLDRILRNGHLSLFFDDEWNPLTPAWSFGHDIEAAWLLVDGAILHDDEDLIYRCGDAAIALAERTMTEGTDDDGGIIYEAEPGRVTDGNKAWWVQAEAIVGYHTAWLISRDGRFLDAMNRSWRYISEHLIDRERGGWIKQLTRDNRRIPGRPRVSLWDCPYHHGRACMEMVERIQAGGGARLVDRLS